MGENKGESHYLNCIDENCERAYCVDRRVMQDKIATYRRKLAGQALSQERIERLEEIARLGLSFAPRGPVPEGLDPTFYHTLNYADEVRLQTRIDAARTFLAETSERSEVPGGAGGKG